MQLLNPFEVFHPIIVEYMHRVTIEYAVSLQQLVELPAIGYITHKYMAHTIKVMIKSPTFPIREAGFSIFWDRDHYEVDATQYSNGTTIDFDPNKPRFATFHTHPFCSTPSRSDIVNSIYAHEQFFIVGVPYKQNSILLCYVHHGIPVKPPFYFLTHALCRIQTPARGLLSVYEETYAMQQIHQFNTKAIKAGWQVYVHGDV